MRHFVTIEFKPSDVNGSIKTFECSSVEISENGKMSISFGFDEGDEVAPVRVRKVLDSLKRGHYSECVFDMNYELVSFSDSDFVDCTM